MFAFLALVTAVIAATPLLIARKFRRAGMFAAAAYLVCWGIYYLAPPSLVEPLWGGAGVAVLVLSAIAAGIACVDDDGYFELNRSVVLPAAVALLFIVRLLSGWSLFRADDYKAMIGQVQERVWTQDVQPKDTHHIRLVPKTLAEWLADKQLGEASGTVGSQFQVDDDRMTIQMIKGSIWYVAPLDFKDFGAWQSTHVSPGYVMVSAEDPLRHVVVKTDQRFAYTPGAYFGHNLERHLWTNGYATRGLTDYTFEVDDNGHPWWVVTVFRPTISWWGERIDGVVIVDPTTGVDRFYAMKDVPKWVDRVVPADIASDYITWRGEYGRGWWNSIWAEKGLTEPGTLTFVHGADGSPYWVTDVTSTNSKDQSLVGLMYTNARTGRSVYYKAVGGTTDSVLSAVNNKVAYRHWHGKSPVIYNIYGTMAAIVPLLGENNTFQGAAIVRVDNLQVAIGSDLNDAFGEYQKALAGAGTATPEIAHARRTVSGKVERFAADPRNKDTAYYLTVTGVPRIFTGSSDLSAKLPLTRPGDDVTVTFIPADGPVVPMLGFRNRSLKATGPLPARVEKTPQH